MTEIKMSVYSTFFDSWDSFYKRFTEITFPGMVHAPSHIEYKKESCKCIAVMH